MRRFRILALLTAVVLLTAVSASAQVMVVEDLEGPLPGPQDYPSGYSYSGGALGNLTLFETQITDQDAVSGVQSFQVTIDASNQVGEGSWGWYGGFGGFHGFFGEGFGFAEGQEGQNNPANYSMAFDLRVFGNNGDQAATPVGGAVGLYKSDYEAVYGIDVNNDGDLDDGFDIWNSTFTAAVTDNNWTHIVWNLASGTDPTTNESPVPTPVFDDASNIYFQIYFNNGGFGIDADNIIRVDNIGLEFVPSTALPGDFNGDGNVDGRDFLLWQRDTNIGNLTDWQSNYGTGGLAAIAVVPEPGSLLLTLLAAAMVGCRRLF
jgi:hypothetical protein